MAAEEPPKIVVESLPGGGKRWRRADQRVLASSPDTKAFKHRIGSGHNLIRLFELFLVAWTRCEETEDGSLLVLDDESASELHGLCMELGHRVFREVTRIPQREGGGIYYDDLAREDRHLLHASLVMSKALVSMSINEKPFEKGTILPVGVRKEFYRALRILEFLFSADEDVAPTVEGTPEASPMKSEANSVGQGVRDASPTVQVLTNEDFVIYLTERPSAQLDGSTFDLTVEQARILELLALATGRGWVPPERLRNNASSAIAAKKAIGRMPVPLRALIEAKSGTQGGRRLVRTPRIVRPQ